MRLGTQGRGILQKSESVAAEVARVERGEKMNVVDLGKYRIEKPENKEDLEAW